jgi:PhoPQ-activated pathogenicity-related protein
LAVTLHGQLARAQNMPTPASGAGTLASFVQRPDPAFKVDNAPAPTAGADGAAVATTAFVSQTFQGTPWRHTLVLVHPKTLRVSTHGILIVSNGRLDDKGVPDEVLAQARTLAVRAGLIVAVMRQVPYQPIFGGLVEDQAIAHTFTKFFQTGDPGWPLLLPMVKSVVRAMDAAQGEAARLFGAKLASFTVTGESKRGWTTWLTAAVDPRVTAIVPMVFDILNMLPQLHHQLTSWGRYSEEIGDYSGQGLPKLLATPRGEQLMALVDPYTFRSALAAPKVIVLGTNDRYWPADAESLYFDALPGPKYRLHLANEGHEIQDKTPVDEDLTAVALAASGVLKLPAVSGTLAPRSGGGLTLTLKSDLAPVRARVWRTRSPTRDLRSATWTAEALPAATTATAAVPKPQAGVAAAFLDERFEIDGMPFNVSGPVGIVDR